MMIRGLFLLMFLPLAVAGASFPGLSEEKAVSPPILGAASYNQTEPALASDGVNFLAVWTNFSASIFATVVTPNQTVNPAAGFPIDTGLTRCGSPAVVWTGETYLVAWWSGPRIMVASVSSAGVVSDVRTIAEDPTFEDGLVRLTTNGNTVLIGWMALAGSISRRFNGVLLSRGGQPLTLPFLIDSADSNSFSIASDGRDYLLAADCGFCSRKIFVTPVSGSGVPGSRRFVADEGVMFPNSLVWNGSAYVIGFNNGQTGSAIVALLDPSLSILTHLVHLGSGDEVVLRQIADRTLVAFKAGEGLQAREFDDQLQFLDSGPAVITARVDSFYAGRYSLDAAVSETSVLFDWTVRAPADAPIDGRKNHWDLRGSVSDQLLARLQDEFVVARSAHDQLQPSVAATRSGYFVAWSEYLPDEATYAVFVERLDAAGNAVGEPVRVPPGYPQTRPLVASDGEGAFVVWVEGSQYRGVRVGPQGDLLDRESSLFPLEQGWAIGDADLEWLGNAYGLIYGRIAQGIKTSFELFSYVVLPDGFVEHGGFSTFGGSNPAIGSLGGRHVVMWLGQSFFVSPHTYLLGLETDDRFNSSGGENTLAVPPMDGSFVGLTVAASERLFLAALITTRNQNDFSIVGTRFTRVGRRRPVEQSEERFFTIASSPYPILGVDSAWDGHTFVMTWAGFNADGTSDIRAARVSEDGAVFPSVGGAISETALSERGPVIASSSAGSSLVAYERDLRDTLAGGTTRVFLRMISSPRQRGVARR